MKKTDPDPNQIGTIGELLAALVDGFNAELRGNGRGKEIPQINAEEVIQAVLKQAQVDRAALDREFSVDLVGETMQVVARYGMTTYGIPFSTPLDEVSVSGVGQMIISIVTADGPMSVVPRAYIRRANVIKRIVELTVVFGAACLHGDVAEAAEESGADDDDDFTPEERERFRWHVFAADVIDSEASSGIYARARAGLNQGEFKAFTAGLRRQVTSLDNALQRRGMAELVANALKYVADQAEKGSAEPVRVSSAAGSDPTKRPMLN